MKQIVFTLALAASLASFGNGGGATVRQCLRNNHRAATSDADAVREVAPRKPKERKYTAPDGCNVITERTDELGIKTRSITLAHVCEVDDAQKGAVKPVAKPPTAYFERKVKSPTNVRIDRLQNMVFSLGRNAYLTDEELYVEITNLCGRIEAIEARLNEATEVPLAGIEARLSLIEKARQEESEAKARRLAEADRRRKEREASIQGKASAKETLHNAIRRGKRVSNKEGK